MLGLHCGRRPLSGLNRVGRRRIHATHLDEGTGAGCCVAQNNTKKNE